jgi:glycosyltransferase involved in cell wall biosynthesis
MSDLFNVWHRGDHVEPPLVSVIIPCYNQAGFLAEAVESVLSQSHKQFEIIVIDDGSTDNTSEVAACFPNVRYINQENQGLSGARNTGMCTSKGSSRSWTELPERPS